MDGMGDLIRTTHEGGVLELCFDRPQKKNAISFAMYSELAAGLADAERDDVRCVLFTSSSETFSAGNDIADFLNAGGHEGPLPPIVFLHALARATKPLVAAVSGNAIGIGATMLLHCDLVYASPTAKLAFPFVDLGVVPEAASSLLLPERVGHAIAAELLLLGATVPAERARELGLVNAIVPPEELRDHARAQAKAIASKPPTAMRLTRALLRGDGSRIAARIDEEAAHFAKCLFSDEAREAFTAFLSRRR
jgi:enoyl-CoA hydratase/carnithine racemase